MAEDALGSGENGEFEEGAAEGGGDGAGVGELRNARGGWGISPLKRGGAEAKYRLASSWRRRNLISAEVRMLSLVLLTVWIIGRSGAGV